MVFNKTWDETKPAGSRDINLGDDDIREKQVAVRERLAVDHAFYEDETGHSDVGYHLKATLVTGASPTQVADTGILFCKDVAGKAELHWIDEDGDEIQLTSGGKFLLDNAVESNNTFIKALDAAGTGTVDLIKANASDIPVLPDGAQMATSAAPTVDAGIVNKKYCDDTFPVKAAVNSRTAQLAASQVVGSTDITSTGSEADMTDMSITLTTTGTKLLCMFSAPLEPTLQGDAINVYINIDGTNKRHMHLEIYSHSGMGAFQHLETGLTPGSHTVKIRWVHVGATWNQKGSSDSSRILTVVDLD